MAPASFAWSTTPRSSNQMSQHVLYSSVNSAESGAYSMLKPGVGDGYRSEKKHQFS